MYPIEFPQQTLILAKDQPQYTPLPVHYDEDRGVCIGCFKLSDEERQAIAEGKPVWLYQYTFGQAFQPVRLTTNNPWPEAEDAG